jgi:hypothetical protein
MKLPCAALLQRRLRLPLRAFELRRYPAILRIATRSQAFTGQILNQDDQSE